MRLYHGSNTNIESIDLSVCRPSKDFGKGFYLTEIKEQAQRMSRRVARIYGGFPVLNIYEIDDNFINSKNMNIKNFGNDVSEEWAVFVMNNRNNNFKDFKNENCNLDNKMILLSGRLQMMIWLCCSDSIVMN